MTDTVPTKHTLYICYFGLRQPLVQTQVLPYLRELRRLGDSETQGNERHTLAVSLLTFEPVSFGKAEEKAVRDELAAQGIDWYWLRYHKWPSVPATFYDILNGVRKVRKLMRRENFDVLHCRSHVPMLMGALARKFSGQRPKLLFDIRGFFPEEYTDAGVWPEGGFLYRTTKRVEKWLMSESDGFVVLTEKAREILFPESGETGFDIYERPVEVIPCCVDFEGRFAVDSDTVRKNTRKVRGIEDRFVIVHLGALGGLYLTNEIADLFAAARSKDPKTFALILTQTDPSDIIRLLHEKGFMEEDYLAKTIAPIDVPEYLWASDIALSFVKSSYSTLSRSPTKIPEYLACGLPIIANSGVGDVDGLIKSNRVGALIDHFSDQAYIRAVNDINELRKGQDLEERCRETARERFDLREIGGKRYTRLYRRLLKGGK